MLTLRISDKLLKICNQSCRRRSRCWRDLLTARTEFRRHETQAARRCFSCSPVSSQSAESTEDALSKELDEMRARMAKLHNVVSAEGAKLADYKRSISEDAEQVCSSPFLEDESEDDQFEDSCGEGESLDDGIDKGLRKHKDADVVIKMPYGHVRFDSMNRQKYKLQPMSEEGEVQDDIPSVEIIKDGHHVFSVNAAEDNETELEYSSDDMAESETCYADSQRERYIQCVKSDVSDEQHFDDVLQQEEEKQRSMAENTTTDSKICPKPNFFDEQYFGNVLQHEGQNQTSITCSKMRKHAPIKSETHDVKPTAFDEQYFGDILQQEEKQQISTSGHVEDSRKQNELNNNENSDVCSTSSSISDELSMIDEQYFGKSELASSHEAPVGDTKQVSHSRHDHHHSLAPHDSSRFQQDSEYDTLTETVDTHSHDSTPARKEVKSIIKGIDADLDNTVVVESITRREMKARTRPKADVENPKTAYDIAVKIRQERQQKQQSDEKQQTVVSPKLSKWTGRVDSHGFRILQEQVTDVQQLTEEQIVLMLKDCIIHEDDKLVVIDKPYGLPSHGGPKIHHSVGKLLEPLASKIDKTGLLQTLYLVHRLDKETTGVMMLAKSLQVSEFLLAMFKKREVVKHYWVITKGVPQPEEGIIDIPMTESIVGNRYRMALRPIVKEDGRPVKASSAIMAECHKAVTKYRVLSENGSAALVHCTPETGVKHQIRCHLAFGLNTPILGDHKYSHYSKIAPQKLHPEMLQMLGIRQAKVRHVPMHLHAKSIVLPEWTNGRNLFLSARLPLHFAQNMKWLKLKPPR